jgi:hypothetical protein
MNSSEKGQQPHAKPQFLYLHKFFYGGVSTFTAHLFHTMGLTQKSQNVHPVLHPTIKSENILRDFGYGLHLHEYFFQIFVSYYRIFQYSPQ